MLHNTNWTSHWSFVEQRTSTYPDCLWETSETTCKYNGLFTLLSIYLFIYWHLFIIFSNCRELFLNCMSRVWTPPPPTLYVVLYHFTFSNLLPIKYLHLTLVHGSRYNMVTKACLNVFGIDCQGLKYNSKNSKYCVENRVPKKTKWEKYLSIVQNCLMKRISYCSKYSLIQFY